MRERGREPEGASERAREGGREPEGVQNYPPHTHHTPTTPTTHHPTPSLQPRSAVQPALVTPWRVHLLAWLRTRPLRLPPASHESSSRSSGPRSSRSESYYHKLWRGVGGVGGVIGISRVRARGRANEQHHRLHQPFTPVTQQHPSPNNTPSPRPLPCSWVS